MSKMMRRTILQDRYDGILPWSIPRKVVSKISNYQRQETILEWITNNKDIYGELIPIVWLKFLDTSEKTPDIPIEELLDAFKEDYKILCEIEGLTIDITMMQLLAKELLVINPSVQPLMGLGNFVELYQEKETKLAELMEDVT